MPTTMTYREALRAAIVQEMDRDPDVFLMGEDIGKYKGTFRVTDGLFEKYAVDKKDWLVPPYKTESDDASWTRRSPSLVSRGSRSVPRWSASGRSSR